MLKKGAKQIDKFTQRVGETLFKEEKTEHSSSFLDLEAEIEVKRRGIERIDSSAQTYVKHLSKREKSEDAATDGKIFPIESLALVMISHGDALDRYSPYGKALMEFGRAHCKIAALQEDFVNNLEEGFLAGMARSMEHVRDYQAFRKKLDSRRVTMDAALKRQNTSKKDSRQLDADVETARARFEETQEDVEMRMNIIHEGDNSQLQDLTEFLEAELSFISQRHSILMELKESWPEPSASANQRTPSSSSPYTATRQRSDTVRSFGRPNIPSRSATKSAYPDSDEEQPPSSPNKKGNRSRSNSAATNKSDGGNNNKRASTGLFGTLTRKKEKSYGNLADEQESFYDQQQKDYDDEDDSDYRREIKESLHQAPSLASRSRSGSSASKRQLSVIPPPPFKRTVTAPASPSRKMVRAKFSYEPTAVDELSLRVGDIVIVNDEISEDWWTGTVEAEGRSGLFPSAYCENYSRPVPPPLPASARPSGSTYDSGSSSRRLPPPSSNAASSITKPMKQISIDDSETEPEESVTYPSESEDDDHEKPFFDPQPTTASPTSSRFPSLGRKAPPPPPPMARRLTVGSSSGYRSGGHSPDGINQPQQPLFPSMGLPSRASLRPVGNRPSSRSVGSADAVNPFG